MHLLRPDPLLVVGPALTSAEVATATRVPPSHPDPAAFIDSLEDGSILRHFDFVARLDRRTSLTTSQIDPLRREGDDLADRTVEVLGLAEPKQRGKDVLVLMSDYLERKEAELGRLEWDRAKKDDVVWRLHDEMARDPPEGVTGFVSSGEDQTKVARRATPLDVFEQIEVRYSAFSFSACPVPVAVAKSWPSSKHVDSIGECRARRHSQKVKPSSLATLRSCTKRSATSRSPGASRRRNSPPSCARPTT